MNITISEEDFIRLRSRDVALTALEAGGVRQWGGYLESMRNAQILESILIPESKDVEVLRAGLKANTTTLLNFEGHQLLRLPQYRDAQRWVTQRTDGCRLRLVMNASEGSYGTEYICLYRSRS